MSWYCDCNEHGDYSHCVTLTKTTASNDGVCNRCGHYAFWDKNRTVYASPKVNDFDVTVYDTVNQRTNYYSSTTEAYKAHGFESEYKFREVLRRNFPHSKKKGVFLLRGIHENAREQFLKNTKNTFVFVYNFKTGEKVTEGFVMDVATELNISESTVMYNLNKNTKPRVGFSFTTEER